MNVKAAIRRAAPVLARYGTIDQGVLTAWLIRSGLSRYEAEQAARFVPLAFARPVLQGMGVQLSDTYIRMAGGTEEERKLADEPFFADAFEVAPAVMSEIGSEAFNAIVMASPELMALNDALNAGVSPDGLVASPPVVTWMSAPAEPPPAKPWWKFW